MVSEIVSKSFGCVVVIAFIVVAMFIVGLDLLKYVFGIDPVQEERERLRQQKIKKKRRPPIIQRFVYVNRPPTPESSNERIPITQETTVWKDLNKLYEVLFLFSLFILI